MYDYQPIVLLSGVYKQVAKVLINQLKPLLYILKYDIQDATMERRLVQDMYLIGNELFDSKLNSKSGGLMFKLDFFEAFDCVCWEFLDDILFKYDFGSKWRSKLLTCWETASFLELIHGMVGKNFKLSRGLRKGNPILQQLLFLQQEYSPHSS